MDYTKRMGGAALGARLRRLSELVDRDATRAYAAIGERFEQRWFGVLNQLALNGPMTVSELAAALRITRASVSQTRQSLEDAGIVGTKEHPTDARQRHLVLTRSGTRLIRRLSTLWRAMHDAAIEVNTEAGNAVAALDRLDAVLARRSLFDRIAGRLGEDDGEGEVRSGSAASPRRAVQARSLSLHAAAHHRPIPRIRGGS